MGNTPRNDILHPRGEGFLRRSYLAKKTPKVKYLPPAEAVKFMPSARNRCFLGNVKKPNMPGVSVPSRSRKKQIGTTIAIPDANVHSLAAKKTWKAHQGSRVTWKPMDIGLKESESCVPNSNPMPSLNDHGRSVDSEQKAGSEIGKEKGVEMSLAKKAEFGMGQKKGNEVSFPRGSCSLGVKPHEFRQKNIGWASAENMTNAPAWKKYIAPKRCKLKYIPPAEAVNLMPGTRRKKRCCDNKKPNSSKVRAQNPKARPPKSRKVGSGSYPPAHADVPKPSGVGLEGSGSSLANSKPGSGSSLAKSKPGSGSSLANSKPGSAVKGNGGSKRMKTAQSRAKVAHAAREGSAGL